MSDGLWINVQRVVRKSRKHWRVITVDGVSRKVAVLNLSDDGGSVKVVEEPVVDAVEVVVEWPGKEELNEIRYRLDRAIRYNRLCRYVACRVMEQTSWDVDGLVFSFIGYMAERGYWSKFKMKSVPGVCKSYDDINWGMVVKNKCLDELNATGRSCISHQFDTPGVWVANGVIKANLEMLGVQINCLTYAVDVDSILLKAIVQNMDIDCRTLPLYREVLSCDGFDAVIDMCEYRGYSVDEAVRKYNVIVELVG